MNFSRALIISALLWAAGCAEPNYQLKESQRNADEVQAPRVESKDAQTVAPVLTSDSIQVFASPTPKATPIPEVFDQGQIHFQLNPEDWKLLTDADGIQAYQELHGKDGIVGLRGEAEMPTTLARIATVLNDFSTRKEWVDSLAEARVIEQKNLFQRIEYNHSKVPWPFQDRDFVYDVDVKVNSNPIAMLISMKSAIDPREPPHDGIVRGEIIRSYYYMKELSSGEHPKTKVVIEMALDPKGAIPLWLMNLAQKRWPRNTLLALRKMAMKPDLVVSKEIESYFAQNPTAKASSKTKKKGKR